MKCAYALPQQCEANTSRLPKRIRLMAEEVIVSSAFHFESLSTKGFKWLFAEKRVLYSILELIFAMGWWSWWFWSRFWLEFWLRFNRFQRQSDSLCLVTPSSTNSLIRRCSDARYATTLASLRISAVESYIFIFASQRISESFGIVRLHLGSPCSIGTMAGPSRALT